MAGDKAARDAAGGDGLEQELRQLLGTLSLRVRVAGDDLATRTGLSPLELAVLARLVVYGPTSSKILVADLSLPRSTMTALADRLESKGLVRRKLNPEDRRSVLLSATAAAEEALDCGAHERFAAIARSLLGAATDPARAAPAALVRRMRQTLASRTSA